MAAGQLYHGAISGNGIMRPDDNNANIANNTDSTADTDSTNHRTAPGKRTDYLCGKAPVRRHDLYRGNP